MVRSKGNMSLKNPVTPPGIDPGTVRLNHYAIQDLPFLSRWVLFYIYACVSVCVFMCVCTRSITSDFHGYMSNKRTSEESPFYSHIRFFPLKYRVGQLIPWMYVVLGQPRREHESNFAITSAWDAI